MQNLREFIIIRLALQKILQKKNVTKKSFRQEKNDSIWKFVSTQMNDQHRIWQIEYI